MVGEGCVEPARGEEDVAGGLDLLEEFEAREHVILRLRDSERMVEVVERLEYPRLDFAPADGSASEAKKASLTDASADRDGA